MKFKNGSVLQLDDGPPNVPNYSGTGVAFTSYKDDTRKGDTNGDGSATSASNGDWIGVYDNTIAVSDYLNWTNIHYDSH